MFLEYGARVLVAQRSPLDDALAMDPRVAYFSADLSTTTDFSPLVDAVIAEFGQLDILVNCAGVMIDQDPAGTTLEAWETTTAVNTRTPLLLAQAALTHLTGGGAIVNIGSIEGLAANPHHAAYAASKGVLHAMTRALAVDLGDSGVRCNAIAPGWIESNLSEDYLASKNDPKSAKARLLDLHPVGRLGRPHDIGRAAAFLASDMASFITGEVLVVDGGRTARLPTPG